MAEFEEKMNLNAEASELEVNGMYKLTREELKNVAGGCGDEEYSVEGGNTHSCPGEDDYEYVYRLIPSCGCNKAVPEAYCGSCSHFTPNEADDWLGPGICRR